MKELTDLTIKELLSSNTATNTLIINQNFSNLKSSILLIQSTFGLLIQDKTIGTPDTKIFVGQVSADKIYLPNISNQNNVNNATITFDGQNGNIKASGISIINDAYIGNDAIIGEKGKGGRIKLYTDRNTDITKPPRLGDFRFIGPAFQGRVIQDEVPSTFRFTILSGSAGQTISLTINSVAIGSTTWDSNASTTSIALVNSILTGGNQYVGASYVGGEIIISSLPGLSFILNSIPVTISGSITTTGSGVMTGGVEGVEKWITFGEGGATGATGPAYGSSGSSGIGGTSGSSGINGSSGTSGTSGINGTSGSSGVSGSSGSSGTNGAIGPRGFTGDTGSSGSSGQNGANGSSGTSGTSGTSPSLSTITSFDVKLGDSSSSGFAWSSGYFSGWNDNYKTGDALIDLDKIIKLLSPTAPPALNEQAPMKLDNYYPNPVSYYPSDGTSGLSINMGSSGMAVSYDIITDSNSTNAILSNMSTSAWTSGGGFSKEVSKTLTAFRDLTNLGSHLYTDQTITPGTNTYGSLEVTEYDYWNGTPGKIGFWPALVTRIKNVMSGGSYGYHEVKLSWETGGTSLTTSFYYDNPTTPVFSFIKMWTPAAGTATISGVPTLSVGDSVNTTGYILNAGSQFYLNKPLYVNSTTEINMTNKGNTITGTAGPDIQAIAAGVVRSSVYTEDVVLNATGYNAKGQTVNSNYTINNTFVGRTMRIDTTSDESPRLLSGGIAGNYPSDGGGTLTYGGLFDSTQVLTSGSYLYELQMSNGSYQRLTGLNYGSNYPSYGPDYSTDSNTDYRWVLFSSGPYTGWSAFSITIPTTGPAWTADENGVTSGVKIFAKVFDSYSMSYPGSTSKWIDCNASWITSITSPGAGASDGDPAMVSGASTATFKRCTFGLTPHSGILYVRIGLPSGSNLKFGNITITKI